MRALWAEVYGIFRIPPKLGECAGGFGTRGLVCLCSWYSLAMDYLLCLQCQ